MSRHVRVKRLRAAEEEEKIEAAQPNKEPKPMQPRQCRTHLRKTLAGAFPDIVAGFVEKAKAGGCQHLRLATALLEVPAQTKRQNTERRIIRGWVKAMEECD